MKVAPIWLFVLFAFAFGMAMFNGDDKSPPSTVDHPCKYAACE